jgi:3-oxoacyl-(acyl-carrier-protein) synthase
LGCDWPAFAKAVRAGTAATAGTFPGASGDDAVPCYVLAGPEAQTPAASGRAAEPLSEFATAAVRQALEEAGIPFGVAPLDDVGLVMNNVLGPSGAVEAYLERLRDRGPRASRPAQFVDTLLSMPASRVGIAFRLRGSTAVLGGGGPFELALDWIRGGRERTVVAGGGECQSPKCLRYHRGLAERSGTKRAHLAQGAAFVVLEAPDRAKERGASALAEILGAGAASEPQEVSQPWPADAEGRAFAVAMGAALADAGVEPDEVRSVALAAGDDASEAGELAALRAVFGDCAGTLQLLRPKRLLGEALGASGSLALLAVLAAPGAGEDGAPTVALVNTFEMGGAASSLVVRVPSP